MYNVQWVVGGPIKATPLTNKPKAICLHWIKINKDKYTYGQLIIKPN